MTHAQATLKDLIQMAHDGVAFYSDAAEQVHSADIRAVFVRMAAHKQLLAETLSRACSDMGGDPPARGTLAGALRKTYAEIKAVFSGKDEQIYVAQLEATEDRLLQQVEAALQDPDCIALHATLRAQLPHIRAGHDEMRHWKQRMAA